MKLFFENVVMMIMIQHMFVMINKIEAGMLHHNIQQELLLRTILYEKIILIMDEKLPHSSWLRQEFWKGRELKVAKA